MKFWLIAIGGTIIFIGLIPYLIWNFPNTEISTYNWGRTYCVRYKPFRAWADKLVVCGDIK